MEMAGNIRRNKITSIFMIHTPGNFFFCSSYWHVSFIYQHRTVKIFKHHL